MMKNLKYISIPNYITQNQKSQDINMSYQTFGCPLYSAPIVLVNHALTGNSSVCGDNGWWNDLIGKDKILSFNIPGNGYDENPENLIENYRDFTAKDIAKLFITGIEKLKINNLFAVIGGSVGGGIAWEIASLKPELAEHIIPIASDWKSTDWLIANCHIQDAILNNSKAPLADARMHAMTLYRTPESFKVKFQRSKKDVELFNVESWLNHHGKTLNNRFQLSAYKMMNQVLKTINITDNDNKFSEIAKQIKSNIHIVTINSDLFFKAEENWNTYIDLKQYKDNI